MNGKTLPFALLCSLPCLALLPHARAQSPQAPVTGVPPAAAAAFKPPTGWRLRKGDGDEPLYCRKEVPTGSRFERWRCLTREQLVQLEAIDRDNRAEMTQGVRMCTSATTWCKSK